MKPINDLEGSEQGKSMLLCGTGPSMGYLENLAPHLPSELVVLGLNTIVNWIPEVDYHFVVDAPASFQAWDLERMKKLRVRKHRVFSNYGHTGWGKILGDEGRWFSCWPNDKAFRKIIPPFHLNGDPPERGVNLVGWFTSAVTAAQFGAFLGCKEVLLLGNDYVTHKNLRGWLTRIDEVWGKIAAWCRQMTGTEVVNIAPGINPLPSLPHRILNPEHAPRTRKTEHPAPQVTV